MKTRVLLSYLFVLVPIVASILLFACGCDSLRLAPSESLKQNAWLHHRTTAVAAETARAEETSQELQALTKLSEVQSRAFTSYYGLPQEYPPAATSAEILAQSTWDLAATAAAESGARPDPWQVADSLLEVGIGISALLGGVYGTRAVRFLKDAQAKSTALKEIIQGNESFKKANEAQAQPFKAAHANQSPETRQLVAAMKG